MRNFFCCLLLGVLGCSTDSSGEVERYSQGESWVGDCETPCRDTNGQDGMLICHFPPGNPDNPQTLCVGEPGWNGHNGHELDHCGECAPSCGDQSCSESESCEDCPQDCGECGPSCGNEECDGRETCEDCPTDCGECPTSCGNQSCDEGEDCESCPADCGECGDSCGDEFCSEGEDCESCPSDCGPCSFCGDETCNEGENCMNCPSDCGYCPCDSDLCECMPELPQCQGDQGDDSGPKDDENEEDVEYSVSGGGCSLSGKAGGGLLLMLLVLLPLVLRKRGAGVLALITTLGISSLVSAEPGENINLERFELSTDESGILNVEHGRRKPQGSWGLNFWLGYEDDPLVLKRKSGGEEERVADLVTDRVGGALSGYYVLRERLQLALELPLVLKQGSEDSPLGDGGALSTFGAGDLRFSPKVYLIDKETDKSFVDVALMVPVYIPTGRGGSYLSEGWDNPKGFGFAPQVILSRWVGNSIDLAMNVGLRNRREEQVLDLEVDDEAFARLGATYGWENNRLAATISMAASLEDFGGKSNQTHMEGMLGYMKDFAPGLQFLSGVGVGLEEGFGTPDFRVLAGLRYSHVGEWPWPEKGPLTCCGGETPAKQPPVAERRTPPTTTESEKEKVPETKVLVFSDVFFKFDRAEILPQAKPALLKVAELINSLPEDVLVAIEGHTDSIGTRKYNTGLSLKRAQAVRKFLIKEGGVDERSRSLQLEYHGEEHPIDTNATEEGRARNRRVIFRFENTPHGVKLKHEDGKPEGTFDGKGKLK